VAPTDKLSLVLIALFGASILVERLATVNWIGIVMIAAGAWLVTLRSRRAGGARTMRAPPPYHPWLRLPHLCVGGAAISSGGCRLRG
jgi:drug/metabolite transporter (DMT)-like permease